MQLAGKLGLLESKSMVPRQNPILQCRLKLGLVESSNSAATKPELAESSGEAASPWSTAGVTTNAAAVAAVTNSADEARPPGFAKHSHSQCRPVMLDLLGPGKVARPEVSKCPKSSERVRSRLSKISFRSETLSGRGNRAELWSAQDLMLGRREDREVFRRKA